MKGHVDEYRQCWVEITIIGGREKVTVDAIVDTGFDGWVCLPIPIAIHLGLELYGLQTVELADGTLKEELVFRGKVIFGDEERWTEITLTSAQDTLLGTGLLADSVLTIDFVDRTLEVARR
jgi:clan AA aspartic protease